MFSLHNGSIRIKENTINVKIWDTAFPASTFFYMFFADFIRCSFFLATNVLETSAVETMTMKSLVPHISLLSYTHLFIHVFFGEYFVAN